MDDENTATRVREHLSDKHAWLRLLYMILFGIAFEVVKFVTFFVAAVQILFKLFTGDVQPRLSGFGASLALFLRQVVDFLTFRSDARPFPWSPWPLPETATAQKTTTADGTETPSPAKPAARRGTGGRRRKGGGPVGGEAKTE